EFNISGNEVFRLAKEGQEDARIMYEAFGVHLGNALKAVLYAYDPEVIIFGGSISQAYSYFKEPMLNTLQDFAYSN
ncbi:MAG: ROK family protein, partial [Planctomycetota bacterium]|nr:ROK family protein [Planctomycetota bacterium]